MKRLSTFHSNAVWPTVWLVVLFLVSYAVLSGGIWFIEGIAPNPRATADFPELLSMQAIILAVAAGGYALLRLVRFHPVCNSAYAAWLKLTPWTSCKPLPLGPVHLVWQDAVVVAVLSAIAAWHAHASPALPALAFGFAYLGGRTLLLAATRTWGHCLVLGFLWPALALPRARGWPTAGLLLAIIVVLWHGHRRSLRAFPWPFLDKPERTMGAGGSPSTNVEIRIPGLSDGAALKAGSKVGWPYMQLSPKAELSSVSTSTSFWLSLMFGWWFLCSIVAAESPPPPGLVVLFAVMAALIRFAIYSSGVAPPFGIAGRIASGRLLLPGFDRIFLSPLAAVMLAILGGAMINRSGAWYPAAEAGVFALVWFVLLSGGPTLRRWLLTGHHRYRVPARVSAHKQLLRSV